MRMHAWSLPSGILIHMSQQACVLSRLMSAEFLVSVKAIQHLNSYEDDNSGTSTRKGKVTSMRFHKPINLYSN